MESLKKQLTEKDAEVTSIKRLMDQTKGTYERELKLMTSAWYEMGMDLQMVNARQRIPTQKPPTTWMGVQRKKV